MELTYKEIKAFDGYFAGSDGNIYSLWTRGKNPKKGSLLRQLKGQLGSSSYLMVHLRKKTSLYSNSLIHRLVCEAFHGQSPNVKYTVSHLNGNSLDNRPENLAWESLKANQARKVAHGTYDGGYLNSRAKITKKELDEIRELLKTKK